MNFRSFQAKLSQQEAQLFEANYGIIQISINNAFFLLPLLLQFSFILPQLLHESFVRLHNGPFRSQQFQRLINIHRFLFYQIRHDDSSTPRNACLAMHKNIRPFHMLFNKLLGRIEKAFDIFRGIVSYQYSELLYRCVYFQLRLSEYADYRSNIVCLQQLKILNEQEVADCQALGFGSVVGLNNPVEVGSGLVGFLKANCFLHIL